MKPLLRLSCCSAFFASTFGYQHAIRRAVAKFGQCLQVVFSSKMASKASFLVLVLTLSWVQEAVPLAQESLSTPSMILDGLKAHDKQSERAQRLEEIARMRNVVKPLQEFCTMDGLFCVPANYSK